MLDGTAKTIYDEVMDEIDEEIREGLENLIVKDKLDEIIKDISKVTSDRITITIAENYKEGMTAVQKLVLGEKVARVVTKVAKEKLRELSSEIIKQSFDLVDELRNEIIGEVFEETE